MPETKHKRGGQPGNQNARKHGFYSDYFNSQQIREFWNIVKLGGAGPEVALLHIKLDSALRNDSAKPRLFREASRLLVKWYSSEGRLDKQDKAELKKYVRNVMEALGNSHAQIAGTNPASNEAKKLINNDGTNHS